MTSPPTETQIDPFAKIKLREDLLHVVYSSWERRLALRMNQIISDNFLLSPSRDAYCLRLRGVCYWHTSVAEPPADYYPSSRLHPSLQDLAHSWVNDTTELATEKRMVSHSLSAILGASNRIEDYLTLLPESLHELCKGYQAVLPDPNLHKLASPEVMQQLQFIHSPYLALMGRRYVMALIL